eukprot:jgi/Galph1/2896/GphlegSOOS_G1575.1
MNVFGKASRHLNRIGTTAHKYYVEFEIKRLQGLMEYLTIKRENSPVCVVITRGSKTLTTRASSNGMWNERLSCIFTLYKKADENGVSIETKNVQLEVYLLKGGKKVLLGTSEVDIASIASISGNPTSEQLELALNSVNNSLRGTELKLNVNIATNTNTPEQNGFSRQNSEVGSEQSSAGMRSASSSVVSTSTLNESISPRIHTERSSPQLERNPPPDEKRFSLFSRVLKEKGPESPVERSEGAIKLHSSGFNKTSTSDASPSSGSSRGRAVTVISTESQSPKTSTSPRNNNLFSSIFERSKKESQERGQFSETRKTRDRVESSSTSLQQVTTVDKASVQKSPNQVVNADNNMSEVQSLRQQLERERQKVEYLQNQVKQLEDQVKSNKASYQVELQQLTSLLFQERNKLSNVEEQRRKLEKELELVKTNTHTRKEEINKSNKPAIKNSDEKRTWNPDGLENSPVNMNIHSSLKESDRNHFKGLLTVEQLEHELIHMKVKYAESQGDLEKERQHSRQISQILENAKQQNNTMALEMSQLQRDLTALRKRFGISKENNGVSPHSKRIASDRSLYIENIGAVEDSPRFSLKKKKGWKKVFRGM